MSSDLFQFQALVLDLDEDIGLLSQYLWQQGVPHQVIELQGKQRLMVQHEQHVAAVSELYQAYRQGQFSLKSMPKAAPVDRKFSDVNQWPWMTLLLIVLSIVGGAIVQFDAEATLLQFVSFQDFQINGNRIQFEPFGSSLASGEYWRVISPIFLHFGIAHLAFNCLWVWELGRRIERGQGASYLLAMTLIVGACSNFIQFLWSPNSFFGGMSGVIYGMIGYCVVWNKLRPTPSLVLPSGIVGFMLVWLFVCMSGVLSFIGIEVANAAHVSGLIAGGFLAFMGASISRAD